MTCFYIALTKKSKFDQLYNSTHFF